VAPNTGQGPHRLQRCLLVGRMSVLWARLNDMCTIAFMLDDMCLLRVADFAVAGT
jgi:hypothetical protein